MSKKEQDLWNGPFEHLPVALRSLRETRGITQAELAGKASVSASAMSRYETGSSGMHVATLGNILAGLDCDVGDLARELKASAGWDGPEGEAAAGRPPDETADNIIIASLVDKVRQDGQKIAELLAERAALVKERDRLLKLAEAGPSEPQDPEK